MKLLSAVAVALVVAVPSVAHAGTVTQETHQGYQVRVFTPTTVKTNALVVMLHGCTQSADTFVAATQIEDLAETEGFVVAAPNQLDSAPSACWQWWDPAHQKRDAGEPKVIADTIAEIVDAKKLDADRVYVAGISAGAAMTNIIGVTYPDRVAAIGVVAGLEYQAATSFTGVLGASGSGGPDPVKQGDLAFTTMGTFARVVPTFVIHGTSDGVVHGVNGDQVAAQWVRTDSRILGLADGAIAFPTPIPGEAGYTFSQLLFRDPSDNALLVEHIIVDGLGHAWPGGKAGGSYSDPKGPDATKLLWDFFAPRTKSAPLVATPDPTPSGTTSSSSSSSSGNANPSDGPPASSSSSSSSSGGCATAPSSSPGIGAALLALAVLASRRRRW